MKLIIVSGLSGSGKSIALHTLEDLGYYSIDNLPPFLLKHLASEISASADRAFDHAAVGMDARADAAELEGLPQLLEETRTAGIECRMIFIDAQNETLIRRFSETRRRHPLTRGERPLTEAIEMERRLLEPIRQGAGIHIDTTQTNVHELRDLVRASVVGDTSPKASILLQSFGFKHGLPSDLDFLFDVRCLPNPHWEPDLRAQTGLDQPVVDFLAGNPDVRSMLQDISDFFDRWVPVFETDGRSYLTIAIGCTGGRHRSVYMVEALRRHFEQAGHTVLARHRELS